MVLFVLMAAEIFTLAWLHYLPDTSEPVDFSGFKKEIDEFYSSAENTPVLSGDGKNFTLVEGEKFSESNSASNPKAELFPFNPNQLPEKDWRRLGFTEKQVRSIKNYESKGGDFKTISDVKKMYAISENEFNRIAPYIRLPEEKKSETPKFKITSKPFLVIDAGTADSTELSKLPMVGDYLAYKIYSYREKLGGFYSIRQLKEVHGLRDSTYNLIQPHLVLGDSTNLRKINLNTAGYDDLAKHPYINSKLANVILAYRKQHGNFGEVTDLQKVALVDAELYRKIAPYLKVE